MSQGRGQAFWGVFTFLSEADLGEGPPLFWVKKEEMTEGRKAGRVSKTKLPPPP